MVSIDYLFNLLMDEIDNMSLDEVFEYIKNKYLKLDTRAQADLAKYLNTFNYWGRLDKNNNEYEAFYNRARTLKEHNKDLRWFYNKLEDYRSKIVLLGILNNWYNFDYNTIGMSKESLYKQYFDLDILKVDKNEVFVDLGAFTGDSIIEYFYNYGEKSYKKIYCYEIDDYNIKRMENNLSKYKNIEIRKKAVVDKKGKVSFHCNGNYVSANSVCDNGEVEVDAVALDEDIKEKITILKMDIEGSEKSAIKGSINHIKNDSPKLLISLYHNHEDIYEIPRMIDEMNNNYKYYLRFYGGNFFPTEFILLAIPKKD